MSKTVPGTAIHRFVQGRPALRHALSNAPGRVAKNRSILRIDILRPSPVREQARLRNHVGRKRRAGSGIEDRFLQPTEVARPELWLAVARLAPETVQRREFLCLRWREAQREPEQRRRRDPLARLPSRVFPFCPRRHCSSTPFPGRSPPGTGRNQEPQREAGNAGRRTPPPARRFGNCLPHCEAPSTSMTRSTLGGPLDSGRWLLP